MLQEQPQIRYRPSGHLDKPYLNPSSVWLEASGWVFGCNSALDGTAVHPDLVLFEVELWQAAAFTNVQLGMHQVHTVEEGESR